MDEQQVIEIKKSVPEITTIYEFNGGNSWEITRSTPQGVFAIGISKGTQSDNKTDVQDMTGAKAYYIANKNRLLEKWTIEATDAKGVSNTREITEGTQADKSEIKDAHAAMTKLESEGLTIVSIMSSSVKLIEMATLQIRETGQGKVGE